MATVVSRPQSTVPCPLRPVQSRVYSLSRVLSRGSCSSLGCWLPINLLLLAVAVQRKQMITLRVRNLSNQSSQGWRKRSTEILAEICFLINATFLVCCIRRPGVAPLTTSSGHPVVRVRVQVGVEVGVGGSAQL